MSWSCMDRNTRHMCVYGTGSSRNTLYIDYFIGEYTTPICSTRHVKRIFRCVRFEDMMMSKSVTKGTTNVAATHHVVLHVHHDEA